MTDHSSTATKSELRRNIRLLRRQMTLRQRSDWDRKINRTLLAQVHKTGASSVAAFLPFDGEPDLHPLLTALAATNITLALPVLEESRKYGMVMHRWRPQSIMQENRFHILEPVNEPPLDLADIDILVMPLVAWDRTGNRLGMGTGFYDRMLAGFCNRNSPLRIGAAFSAQQVERVPVDTWDIPLHAIVNETGWFSFSKQIVDNGTLRSRAT